MDRDVFFQEARDDAAGPLAGIRVLEATTSWAGPVAAALLADMGAEVIKIEHPEGEIGRVLGPHLPEGDGLSLLYETANRNKRNFALDLRDTRCQRLALDLAMSCDVFIENFKPGTLADWGLGYEQVRAVKPDIVYLSISGFGQYGPHHERAGYDPLVQAQSGWMSLNGEIEGGPVKAPTFLGDDLAALHGALATLAALRHRDVAGEGQHIDVALMDAILGASNMFPSLARMGLSMQRSGNQFPQVAPFNVYACSDGHVFLGMSLNHHWHALVDIMARPDLKEDPRFRDTRSRTEQREVVDGIVADWCAGQSQAYVVETCGRAGLPVAPVNTFAQAAADPHVDARAMLQSVTLTDGTRVPLLGPVPKFSRTPVRVRAPAPAVGQDTEALLDALGVDEAQRRSLRERGLIR